MLQSAAWRAPQDDFQGMDQLFGRLFVTNDSVKPDIGVGVEQDVLALRHYRARRDLKPSGQHHEPNDGSQADYGDDNVRARQQRCFCGVQRQGFVIHAGISYHKPVGLSGIVTCRMSTTFAEDSVVSTDSQMSRDPSSAMAVDSPRASRFSPSRKTVCVSIFAAATAVIAPYVLRGYTAGHDIGFHVSCWLEISGLFREGILRPRWAELAFGYGDPTFIFYPPLSLYLGAILTLLLPFRMVPGAYVWLALVLAGFSFFYLCRHFLDVRSALVGAVVYVMNPYHLLQVHGRCSFSELLVSATLPLLLLATYRMSEPGRQRVAAVALLLAIISLTSMPGGVAAGYSAFVFAIALTLTRNSGAGLIAKFAIAGILGAGLAGFFLLPAWFEKPWVIASVYSAIPPEARFVRLNLLPHGRFAWALAAVEVGQILVGGLAWAICRRTKPRDTFWAFTAVFSASVIMVLPISAG